MTEIDFFYSYFYDHVSLAFSNSEEMNEMAKYYLEKCCNVLENTSIIRIQAPYNCAGNKVIAPIFFENERGDLLYCKNMEYGISENGNTDASETTNHFIQELLPLFKQQVKVMRI